MTVVAACELEDAVARSERARQARRAHRRLGAGGDEPDLLDRRDRVDDLPRKVDLGFGRRAEARPTLGGSAHRRDRLRIGVPEEQRAPRHDPVDVTIAVYVDEIRPLAAAHEQRLVEPDRTHRAHGGVHTAGNEVERPAVQRAPRPQSQVASSFVQ